MRALARRGLCLHARSADSGLALTPNADLWHQTSPTAHVKLVKTERLHALENYRGSRDDEARVSPCACCARSEKAQL